MRSRTRFFIAASMLMAAFHAAGCLKWEDPAGPEHPADTSFGIAGEYPDGNWMIALDGPAIGGVIARPAADGGALVVYSTYQDGRASIGFTRISSTGIAEPSLRFDDPSFYALTGTDCAATPDNGAVICGYGHATDNTASGFALKLGKGGGEEWRSVFGSPGDYYMSSVVALDDGTIALAGTFLDSMRTMQAPGITLVDSNGYVLSERTYATSFFMQSVRLWHTPPSGFRMSVIVDAVSVSLLRIDPMGHILSLQDIGMTGPIDPEMIDADQSSRVAAFRLSDPMTGQPYSIIQYIDGGGMSSWTHTTPTFEDVRGVCLLPDRTVAAAVQCTGLDSLRVLLLDGMRTRTACYPFDRNIVIQSARTTPDRAMLVAGTMQAQWNPQQVFVAKLRIPG